SLPLPRDLPEGYHTLTVEGDAIHGDCTLVVAPDQCYLPEPLAEGARVWGTTLQLYSIRSERNAGIGDFTDLRHAVEAWAERGAAFVGTNPLHSLGANTSPYSPSSRLFVNPLYIDVEAVEDFAELAAEDDAAIEPWRSECARLRATEEVDY